jgi:uncharacterized protein with HEPN domain
MPRGHRDRIGDILAAIADIRADTEGMSLTTFEKNPVIVRSVLYSIGVIGEAVKAVDQDFKDAHPEIPWRAIAGIRDRIVHEYFRTNTEVEAWVSVADVGEVRIGGHLTLFLKTRPLSPLKAKIRSVAYEAAARPDSSIAHAWSGQYGWRAKIASRPCLPDHSSHPHPRMGHVTMSLMLPRGVL